jgi:hypothetical protein
MKSKSYWESETFKKVIKNPNQQMFPLWDKSVRGIPNCTLRSSMFSAIKKDHSYKKQEKIASLQNIEILYTGIQLDQGDLDVWEHCIELAKKDGLQKTVEISGHSFLSQIGRAETGVGTTQYEWLKSSFRKLAAALIEVRPISPETKKTQGYFGTMIEKGYYDDEKQRFLIKMNPDIVNLYTIDSWTGVKWVERLSLKKYPLAQWLHGFYSSHKEPIPYKIEIIHSLCGSQTKKLYHFKVNLKKALEKLCEETGWSYEIKKDGKVYIYK